MQIVHFLGRQSQTFLLVVFLKIVDILDGFRLVVDGKDFLVQTFIHTLQHGVVLRIF